MTEQEICSKYRECFGRWDAAELTVEQARADAEALDALTAEYGYDVAAD
jgi:hypothetical protein